MLWSFIIHVTAWAGKPSPIVLHTFDFDLLNSRVNTTMHCMFTKFGVDSSSCFPFKVRTHSNTHMQSCAVICHSLLTLLRCVGLASISATDPTSYPVTHNWRCQDYCAGIHCLPSGLVQLAVVWCAGEPGEESAVSTECCRSLTHQCTQMWPHHSAAASVTLATCPQMSWVQDCVSCTPVSSYNCTNLPDIGHSSCIRAWSSPSAFVYW